MADFLFDSSGDWIVWRRSTNDKFLFNDNGDAIGWFPWDDADAVDMDGEYLGTVVGNRLLRKNYQPYRGYPGYPGYSPPPAGFSDLLRKQLKS